MINKLRFISWSFVLVTGLLFTACQGEKLPEVKMKINKDQLIPLPLEVEEVDALAFIFNDKMTIHYKGEGAQKQAAIFGTYLSKGTGMQIAVNEGDAIENSIYFGVDDALNDELGSEGYKIDVAGQNFTVQAAAAAGLFYGIQTLKQLLPVGLEQGAAPDTLALGACKLMDKPRYGYRGSMLDVARHFFDVPTVKKYIDYMTRYKMNTLHLHLSDDQGWRIEIKSWPKLTEIGGSTEVGGGEGGFYTQEQYQEIIQYAADRFITVIPEIDMPGHTNAALASYAELNCDGKATELYSGIEVGFSTLCIDKEITYQFVDDVIKELSMLTPGPYIHVGGDESHVTAEPDYIVFVNKVQEIVNKYEKVLIGWDEVTLGSLSDNAVAQYWASAENAKNAADKNLKVIMSPAAKTYMDMKYDTTTELGLSWAGLIEVETGYNWDPSKLEDGLDESNILGVEAPLWSETVTNLKDIEYMLFPRLAGYAEVGWTPQSKRNWENYKVRLANQQAWMEANNINFYKSPQVEWKKLAN